MKPGRVTRSGIVCGSWQSMQATGCSTQLARLGVGHRVHLLEARDQVAAARLLVGHVDRRVAVDAGAGLLGRLLALGERLVVEHVGVAALLAEVHREGVAGPHRLQARILLEPRLRDDRARDRPASACAARPRCRRSACAAGRPCAGSRRTAAGSSCPRWRDRRSRRSARRRGRTGSAPPACARRCSRAARRPRRRRRPQRAREEQDRARCTRVGSRLVT